MVESTEDIFKALIETGLSEQEINQQIKQKLTEYQGFMNEQAVLFLIAKENGVSIYSSEYSDSIKRKIEELIDYNDFAIPIADISETMSNIVITGRITQTFNVNNFTRKDGTQGVVGSFQMCDTSDFIKVVLWSEQVKIMENEYFTKGEIVQVVGGYSKKGNTGALEVHLSKKGKIVLAPKDIDPKKLPKVESYEDYKQNKEGKKPKTIKKTSSKKDAKLNIQEIYDKEGFIKFISGIVQIDLFKELTLKNGEKSFLLKLIISDDSASIHVNIWGMKAVECLKIIKEGDGVRLSNVLIKENTYSNEKELNFTKSSRIEAF